MSMYVYTNDNDEQDRSKKSHIKKYIDISQVTCYQPNPNYQNRAGIGVK